MFCLNLLTTIKLSLLSLVLININTLVLASSANSLTFSQTERITIQNFGPWPPAIKKDKSNTLSQLAFAQKLGRTLFTDAGLSLNKQISCASCHQPDKAFTDQQAIAVGLSLGHRNTPTLWNVSLKRWYGWGGSIDTLWGASLRALLNPKEMGATATSITHYLATQPQLMQQLRQLPLWKKAKSTQDKLVVVGKLLASYQEQLISKKSEFDYFRQALIDQDKKGIAKYSDKKKRGLKLFIGKGNCQVCHTGSLFSNNEFADIGIPYFDREGKVDKGRYQGIKSVKTSIFFKPRQLQSRHIRNKPYTS